MNADVSSFSQQQELLLLSRSSVCIPAKPLATGSVRRFRASWAWLWASEAHAGDAPEENIRKFFEYNRIECVGSVTAQGPASCFTCGHGETCKVGAIHMFFGPGTKITDEIIPNLAKQPEAIEKARRLGMELSGRLTRFAQAT